MKKFVVLSLISFLILAFGATVYGQEKAPALEFKASGFIDAQTEWLRYYSSATTAPTSKITGANFSDKEHAFLDTRAHLRFDMIWGKEVSGTFLFEMDSSTWGDRPSPNIVNFREQGALGQWNGDKTALEIKNLFMDFGLPFMPVQTTVRVGLQPLSIRPGLLVYTDGMGITAGIKIDPVTIIPLWFKPEEWTTNNSDDVDVYGLHLNARIGTLTVGGYGLYYNMNTYPFFVGSTFGGIVSVPVEATQSAEAWWLGLYADGKVGPLNINFDFIYDDAKVDNRNLADVDYSGLVLCFKLDYPWERFNFGFQGMYATGNDKKGRTDSTLWDYDGYVVPPGSEAGPIFGESVVFYSSWVNRGNTGIANTISSATLERGPVGGTWFGKLYAGFKVIPEWKVTAQVLYIGDTTKNGNTFGSAQETATTLRDDDEIGWEFDLYNEFTIHKNLKYTIAAGVMAAGNALDVYDGTSNRGLKTPWAVISRLIYSF